MLFKISAGIAQCFLVAYIGTRVFPDATSDTCLLGAFVTYFPARITAAWLASKLLPQHIA